MSDDRKWDSFFDRPGTDRPERGPAVTQPPPTASVDRATAEILGVIRICSGSDEAALTWFRTQAIPSLGGQTAETLVRQGREKAVKRHLARLAVGGYS